MLEDGREVTWIDGRYYLLDANGDVDYNEEVEPGQVPPSLREMFE